jgi:hypothetical protein
MKYLLYHDLEHPERLSLLSEVVNAEKVEDFYCWLTGRSKHGDREALKVYLREDEAESKLWVGPAKMAMELLEGNNLDVVGIGLYKYLFSHRRIEGYYIVTFGWSENGGIGFMIRLAPDDSEESINHKEKN